MRKAYALITAGLLALLVACGPGTELTELRTQVEDLQGELESAQTALEEAQARVAELEDLELELGSANETISDLEAALTDAGIDLAEAEEDAEAVAADADEPDAEAAGDEDSDVETADDVVEDLLSTDEADGVDEDDAETDDAEATDAEATDADAEDVETEDLEDEPQEETGGEASVSDAATAAAAATTLAALPENAQAGGSVTVAITAEPPGWDPTVSTSQEIARVMYHNVYEGLVRFDEGGSIVPALAESWEVSDDGLSWTFNLREGVLYHDGSDFTLEDVVAKFGRATDPDSGHTNSQYYAAIERVEADGNAVTFTLSEPSSSLLYNLARPDSIIYPAALSDSQVTDPIGTGPFRFAEYVEGSEVRLERFEDYYLAGVPILDEAVFRIIGDANTRFAALQSGDIDLIGTSLAPEQFQELEELEGVTGAQGDATTEITMALNNAREPLDNPLVRQAITHAIDKEVIVEGAMFGLGTVIGSHVSPSESYFVDLAPYPYDPERARELLAEAGYEDGLELSFELPEPYNIERRAGEVIAQQLAEVGIDVDLSVVEWGTWIERIFTGGDYDMTIIGHSEPRDINVYGNPDYYYGYDNEAVRDLLAQIEETADTDEQNELFVQIAETIAEDAVNVWVFAPPYLVAASEDVGGYWTNQPTPSIDVTGMYRLEN